LLFKLQQASFNLKASRNSKGDKAGGTNAFRDIGKKSTITDLMRMVRAFFEVIVFIAVACRQGVIAGGTEIVLHGEDRMTGLVKV
jgi:hypothetical protein